MGPKSYRLVAVLAAAVTVSAAGCGGDDDETAATQPAGDGVAAGRTPSEHAGDRDRQHPTKPKRGEGDGSASAEAGRDADHPARGRPKSFEEALRRASAARRNRLLRRALDPVVEVAGIEGSTFSMSSDLRTLTIAVPASRACRVKTADESLIAKGVRQVLGFVDSVVTVVESTPLATWVDSHCDRGAAGDGSGVVLRQSGFGPARTRPFRVRAKRWIVEYTHHGDFFSVFVKRGKRYDSRSITSRHPGSGRATFEGPGRFRLDISGSGDWTVRVRALG